MELIAILTMRSLLENNFVRGFVEMLGWKLLEHATRLLKSVHAVRLIDIHYYS